MQLESVSTIVGSYTDTYKFVGSKPQQSFCNYFHKMHSK